MKLTFRRLGRGPLAFVLFAVATNAAAQASLSIASFNIRFDGIGEDRWAWEKRSDLVLDAITETNADIVGLQEVTSWEGMELVEARQIATLREGLPDYDLACAEPVDQLWSSNPILFRRDRLRLLDSGVIYLAGANRADAPRGTARGLRAPEGWWGDMTGRFASWARFADTNGSEFVVVNAHFSPVRPMNRFASAGTLARHVGEIANGAPVVVTGDLNATPFSSSVARVMRGLDLVDPAANLEQGTYNRGKPEPRRGRIDYVLVPSSADVTSAKILAPRPGGRYPSDHDIVRVDVVLKL